MVGARVEDWCGGLQPLRPRRSARLRTLDLEMPRDSQIQARRPGALNTVTRQGPFEGARDPFQLGESDHVMRLREVLRDRRHASAKHEKMTRAGH